MELTRENTLDELVRAGSLLSRDLNFKAIASVLVEQAIDITESDLACLYLFSDPDKKASDLLLTYRRGNFRVPEKMAGRSDLIDFVTECDETIVLLEPAGSPFQEMLLNPDMQSGITLPITIPIARLGVLILNSKRPLYYNRMRFHFLDSFAKVASGMLHNARLYQEMRDYLRRIEEMERYQENIFSSMTNLLITTDRENRIRYYNASAQERLRLSEKHLGLDFNSFIGKSVGKKIIKAIGRTAAQGNELLGVEGIYRGPQNEMDFSLNVTPLKGKRGRREGQTFLFTDQTRERELQEQMESVVEERRIIKDMFSRYLSAEIVQKLVETPEMTQLGGGKRVATIFFADIRGYTSFSEGKDPEYIIHILNEYFNEAVEIVLQHRGYIDKFIGDCIMAAWGVPLQTEQQDAMQAVSCALEIQKRVASKDRAFFKGEASGLEIGIGMHTGPLVAGNLGGTKRMNYTVIGDTVNVAARLEGVAEGGEVIITQQTRDYLGSAYVVEQRQPVRVKGKAQPLPIYAVQKKAS